MEFSNCSKSQGNSGRLREALSLKNLRNFFSGSRTRYNPVSTFIQKKNLFLNIFDCLKQIKTKFIGIYSMNILIIFSCSFC